MRLRCCKRIQLFRTELFMNTICLNMIVKNEAAIIADTLDNILEHMPIDYWVIADTGSTDDTVAIITDFFTNAVSQVKSFSMLGKISATTVNWLWMLRKV